jgi:bifunctional non-homologous end joining protein LigD
MTRTRQSLVADASRLRYRAQPRWMPPMLATLVDAPPGGSGWLYEPKLDGVRVLAHVTGGKVRLWSRNRKPVEGGYPELVAALETATRGDAVLDGEIVALDPKTGLSSFARLQQRMQLRYTVRAARTV